MLIGVFEFGNGDKIRVAYHEPPICLAGSACTSSIASEAALYPLMSSGRDGLIAVLKLSRRANITHRALRMRR